MALATVVRLYFHSGNFKKDSGYTLALEEIKSEREIYEQLLNSDSPSTTEFLIVLLFVNRFRKRLSKTFEKCKKLQLS